ncbi:GNAT family N-acetyltransferase [Frigoribacterium faeni]|uniref:GNAT family N-acetyltransferase n=1 Tax=Frigoribacterium faeni TaxID=145483 RepID=UPI00141A67A9|nr:GNAT family protein [Frigoribacterium faeni]NIJ05874.1 RimJ/RimL family protein N-acetyltransferase [Frigoribacterium faeni]
MSPSAPLPHVPLVGRLVTVAPLTLDDLPELHRAIGRPEVFAGGWGGGAAAYRADYDGWAEFMRGYLLWDSGLVYGVRRTTPGPDAGELLGTTTVGQVDLRCESAHLGWTAYAPEVWGTGVNVETKLLVLGSLFDHGLGRVQIQADGANERSRAAILRLGATFEGVQRRTQPRADGSWRDTAVYSVLADEWPGVRDGLMRRLETVQQPSR